MPRHDVVREQLKERLARLTRRVGKIGADLRKPQDRDWQERAVEMENDEVLEGLDSSTLDEVRMIQTALGRIDEGTYGACSKCGEPIADARLKAMPHAATCVGCAS